MAVSKSSGSDGGANFWGVVRSAGLVILGLAMVGGAVYVMIGMERIVLEPTARVHVECGFWYSGYSSDSCTATWKIDERTVHGTASDPFPDHQYSRFIEHRRDPDLTMHVSGNRARMTPHPKSVIAYLLLFLAGVATALYPFLEKITPRRWRLSNT